MNETLSNFEYLTAMASLFGLIGIAIMFKNLAENEAKERKRAITAEFCIAVLLMFCPVIVNVYFKNPCEISKFNGEKTSFDCLDSELIQVIKMQMEKDKQHRSGE